ncbi:MAG: LysR family transcriptional regulator [Paracoccus sp. (in: a-proteobacteria)]|uniref:LysR family transcriptional regulator n=1 Tax=Paracoccus sp. TaxID=267 RepID=UPI00391A4AD4
MDRVAELEVFLSIADEANLTRASEVLGMSVSGVSRALSGLERRLGVRLIQRTTRQLALTSEGSEFARSAREILSRMREAEDSVSRGAAEPHGLLRIGASLSFAMLHLVPVIRDFSARYPLVQIDLQASNRYQDIVESGLDLAIRTKVSEPDSSITIRRLAEVPRVLAASPGYLARHGLPASPEDLTRHSLLLYTLADDFETMVLSRGTDTRRFAVKGSFVGNDGQLIRQAAQQDMGILLQPAYILHDDLAAGRLVRVLEDWCPTGLTMNVAYPTRSYLPLRSRLFIDALVTHFAENALEARWHRGATTRH